MKGLHPSGNGVLVSQRRTSSEVDPVMDKPSDQNDIGCNGFSRCGKHDEDDSTPAGAIYIREVAGELTK